MHHNHIYTQNFLYNVHTYGWPGTYMNNIIQVEVLTNTWQVFDKYKDQFLIGELIWNFQDFESYPCKPATPIQPHVSFNVEYNSITHINFGSVCA